MVRMKDQGEHIWTTVISDMYNGWPDPPRNLFNDWVMYNTSTSQEHNTLSEKLNMR